MSAIHRTALRWKLLSKVWENHWGLPTALVSTRSMSPPARTRATQYRPCSRSNHRDAGRQLPAAAEAGVSADRSVGRGAGRSARPVRVSSRCTAPSTRARSSAPSRGIHSAQRRPRCGATMALTAITATETAGDRARASKPRTRTASVTSSPGITRIAAHRAREGTRLSHAMGCGLRFRGVPSVCRRVCAGWARAATRASSVDDGSPGAEPEGRPVVGGTGLGRARTRPGAAGARDPSSVARPVGPPPFPRAGEAGGGIGGCATGGNSTPDKGWPPRSGRPQSPEGSRRRGRCSMPASWKEGPTGRKP